MIRKVEVVFNGKITTERRREQNVGFGRLLQDFHSVGVCFYGCSRMSSDFGAGDLGETLSERSNKERSRKAKQTMRNTPLASVCI